MAVEIFAPGQPLETLARQHAGVRSLVAGNQQPKADRQQHDRPRPAAPRGAKSPSSPRARSNHSDWATAGMPMPPVVRRSTSSTATPTPARAGGKVPLRTQGIKQRQADHRDGQADHDRSGVGRGGTDLAQGDRQEESADQAGEDEFPSVGRRPRGLAATVFGVAAGCSPP